MGQCVQCAFSCGIPPEGCCRCWMEFISMSAPDVDRPLHSISHAKFNFPSLYYRMGSKGITNTKKISGQCALGVKHQTPVQSVICPIGRQVHLVALSWPARVSLGSADCAAVFDNQNTTLRACAVPGHRLRPGYACPDFRLRQTCSRLCRCILA